jgi:hypothetical protein
MGSLIIVRHGKRNCTLRNRRFLVIDLQRAVSCAREIKFPTAVLYIVMVEPIYIIDKSEELSPSISCG